MFKAKTSRWLRVRWLRGRPLGIGRSVAASTARPSLIRAKTPMSPHRCHRSCRVLAGPYSLGASRHRKPLRFMKIIPLGTRTRAAIQSIAFQAKGLRPAAFRDFWERTPEVAPSVRRSVRKDRSPWPPQFGGLNHAGRAASSERMGPASGSQEGYWRSGTRTP